MAKIEQDRRRIALFVEGQTERFLPPFIRKWLDPRLDPTMSVGITPVKFHGVSDYLDNLAKKIRLYLDEAKANFVVGLIDLYGIPPSRIDLSKSSSVHQKIRVARGIICRLVPSQYRDRFRQYFAVHETEAWLLAYPEELSRDKKTQAMMKKRRPEQVNFDEPPAKFLKRVLGSYKKTTVANNLFPKIDPQVAIDQCPHLKQFMEELLQLARILQQP